MTNHNYSSRQFFINLNNLNTENQSNGRTNRFSANLGSSVTDMQHYCHARYTTEDLHLAYMFLLVYFSVKVYLEGVFPHSVSTRRDPCGRVYAPLTPAPPSRENKIEQGWPGTPLAPSEFMGCVINRIHYGLNVVFYFRHFTVCHYHHYARLIAGTEHILMSVDYLVEVCLTCC